MPPGGSSLVLHFNQVSHVVCLGIKELRIRQILKSLNCFFLNKHALTLVHDVLLQGLRVVGDCLVQILQQFAHARHWNAEGLNEEEQLLRLEVLQRCVVEKVIVLRRGIIDKKRLRVSLSHNKLYLRQRDVRPQI